MESYNYFSKYDRISNASFIRTKTIVHASDRNLNYLYL